ncbi:MAG: peptidoglycan DD-metalloendopeptidase family protein [Candidatus Omnitrophica bacterium]|nr:peptidoglycan DD-metalloendopeptidase family protein [Candidatus Omnitrophota bacterium]
MTFKKLTLLILVASLGLLAGCSTVTPTENGGMANYPEPERRGVYHKIRGNETLWNISKTYGVALEDIIRVNNIPDVAKLEKDQLLFIPGADTVKEIVPQVSSKDKESGDFSWPVNGKVTGYFGNRRQYLANKGIDIQVPGGTRVRAARSGKVVLAGYLPGYGNSLILDHGDGYRTVYANNAQLKVRLNDRVAKGQEIAVVGGDSGKGSYLHFQIRKGSIEHNPLFYLP